MIEAPFDLMSDTLRGMRGIMLDLYRRPEKLLAAQEKVLRIELEYAIGFSQATGLKVSFIPLHRGSDGFMSLPQFEKFYWPQLKALMVGLVEAGIMPYCLLRGDLGRAPEVSGRAAQRKDRRLVPVERYLQGQGDRGRHDVHRRRHAQLPAPGRLSRRGAPSSRSNCAGR